MRESTVSQTCWTPNNFAKVQPFHGHRNTWRSSDFLWRALHISGHEAEELFSLDSPREGTGARMAPGRKGIGSMGRGPMKKEKQQRYKE